MELIPAAKSNCGSKLRKALRNSGDKHKIFLKVHVMNGDAYFSIRDLESGSQGKQGSSTELQTSILDYYTKRWIFLYALNTRKLYEKINIFRVEKFN